MTWFSAQILWTLDSNGEEMISRSTHQCHSYSGCPQMLQVGSYQASQDKNVGVGFRTECCFSRDKRAGPISLVHRCFLWICSLGSDVVLSPDCSDDSRFGPLQFRSFTLKGQPCSRLEIVRQVPDCCLNTAQQVQQLNKTQIQELNPMQIYFLIILQECSLARDFCRLKAQC